MPVFPTHHKADENYRLLVLTLVERLGGSVTLTKEEVDNMTASRKRLYIESSQVAEAVTLEVLPE